MPGSTSYGVVDWHYKVRKRAIPNVAYYSANSGASGFVYLHDVSNGVAADAPIGNTTATEVNTATEAQTTIRPRCACESLPACHSGCGALGCNDDDAISGRTWPQFGGLVATAAAALGVLTAIAGAAVSIVNLSAGYTRLADKVNAVARSQERFEAQIAATVREIRTDQIRNSAAQADTLQSEVTRRDASDLEIKTLLMRVYDRIDAIADHGRVRRSGEDGPAPRDGSDITGKADGMTPFETCVDFTLRQEGGFSDDPRDPGGATNFGITQGVLCAWRHTKCSVADVRDLTETEAASIYGALYWNPVRGDCLPSGIDLMVFDMGVNAGVRRAAIAAAGGSRRRYRWLHRAANAGGDRECRCDGGGGAGGGRSAGVLSLADRACRSTSRAGSRGPIVDRRRQRRWFRRRCKAEVQS